MIYTVYLSKDHPVRDFLSMISMLIFIFMCVGLGIGLAEELFGDSILTLLVGGIGGFLVYFGIMNLWDKMTAKFDDKKSKSTKRTTPLHVKDVPTSKTIKTKATSKKGLEHFKDVDWNTVTLADVAYFIDEGLDVNARGNIARVLPNGGIALVMNGTPLDVISKPEIAEYLIEHGADVNNVDTIFGTTPLHNALNPEIAKVLISHGADIEHRTNINNTPLLSALKGRRFFVADYLVDCGADVNAKDKDGKTALFFEMLPQFTKKLLDHGADKNVTDNKGMKAIDYMHDPDVIKLLQ